MNSPKLMTEFEERANNEIRENFDSLKTSKGQSYEEYFENMSLEDDLNFDTKFDEFLGDSQESTEISFIVNNLSLTNVSNFNSDNQKSNSDNDSQNIEILNILKRHPNTTKNVPCRGYSHGMQNTNNNLPSFSNSIKKISLAGRILKSADNTQNDTISPLIVNTKETLKTCRPERISNPIMKNSNLNEINDFHFFEKFQLNKL